MVTERTLWLDGSQTRFFLIPDDQALPPGELTLRTLLLRHQRVDEATAALYEVTQDAANEHLKGQFARAGNALKDSISALAARMAEPTGAEAADGAQGTDDAAAAAPVAGEAQKDPREQSEAAQAQIRRGAELLEEGVRTFLSGLKDAFKDALDQIPIGAKGGQAAAPADAAAAPAPAQATPPAEAPSAASAPAAAPANDEPAAR